MRALIVAALVFVAALAGCTGKKDADTDIHYECPDGTELHSEDFAEAVENLSEEQTKSFLKTKCKGASGTGTSSKTNSTVQAPNQLPVLKLNVTDTGGNATNVTTKNGNLTFSAAGSFDPDGQLTGIAIIVKDSNQTRSKTLYSVASKQFTPATFTFDRAGVVNVTIQMVDDRAGFNTTLTKAYVNEVVRVGNEVIHGPASASPAGADPCRGAAAVTGEAIGSTVVDAQYFKNYGIPVLAGAQYIVAVPDANNLVTICDPALTAISPAKQSTATETNPDVVLAEPPGTTPYKVGVYVGRPQTTTGVTVTIHYEPRPAAAA